MKNLCKRLILAILVLTAGTGQAGMWESFSTFLSKNKQQSQVAAALAVGAVCAAAYLYLRGTDQSIRIHHLEDSQNILSSKVDLYEKNINNLQDKLGRSQEQLSNSQMYTEELDTRHFNDQQQISELTASVSCLERQLEDALNSNNVFGEQIEQLNARLAQINQQYSGLSARAATEVFGLHTQIEQLETRIAVLSTRIEDLTIHIDVATVSIDSDYGQPVEPTPPAEVTAAASDSARFEPVMATSLQFDLSDCVFVKLSESGDQDDRSLDSFLSSKATDYSSAYSTVALDFGSKSAGFYKNEDGKIYRFEIKRTGANKTLVVKEVV